MKALNALSESFLGNHPIEAAEVLEGVEEKPLARFLSQLDPDAAGKVMEHIDPEVAAGCFVNMTQRAAASILEALTPHARVVTLRYMPEKRREGVLSAMDDQIAEQARRMLRFSEESVATLMDTDVLTLPEDMRVDEAMRRIRRVRRQFGDELYVVDRKHQLVGVTTLHALLTAPPDQLVSASTSSDCPRVLASTPQRHLVAHPLWAEHNSVAVVDEDNVILGVVDHRGMARAGERLRLATGNEGGLEAALALGELYWMGLAGMLDGLAGRGLAATRTEEAPDGKSAKS